MEFHFHFDPTVADRLNHNWRGTGRDVRQSWKIILNEANEVVVRADPVLAYIPRQSITRVDYTNDLPPTKTAGACPDREALWAVPALEALVSIDVDPPGEGYYARTPYTIKRIIVSPVDPDRFIELVKPTHQEKVSPRPPRRSDASFEDWKPPHLAKSLEDLWIDFARQLLGLMDKWVTEHGMPTRLSPYVDFSTTPPNHICKETPWYGRLLASGQAFLMNMPELDRVADRLLHDGELRIVDREGKPIAPDGKTKPSFWLTDRLTMPILALVERWGTYQLSDEQILEALDFYRHAWTSPTQTYEVTIPLLRIEADIDERTPIKGLTLQIAPFLCDEKEALWNQASFPDMMELVDFRSFGGAEFALVGLEDRQQLGDSIPREALRDAADFVTALRLFKPGDVGTAGVFEREPGPFGFRSLITSMHESFGVRQRVGVRYKLSAAELVGIESIFRDLRSINVDARKALDVALRHFNQSYARNLQEDRIIDLTVALESTLLYKTRGELTAALARRGSALVIGASETTEQESRLVDIFKALYDARSGIVHDGVTFHELTHERTGKDVRRLFRRSCPGVDFQDMPERWEDLVRRVLRAYLALLKSEPSLDTINYKLDNSKRLTYPQRLMFLFRAVTHKPRR